MTAPNQPQAAQITAIHERLDRMDEVSRVAAAQRDRTEAALTTVSRQVDEVSVKIEVCVAMLTAVVGRDGGVSVNQNQSNGSGAAGGPSALKKLGAGAVAGGGAAWLWEGGIDRIGKAITFLKGLFS